MPTEKAVAPAQPAARPKKAAKGPRPRHIPQRMCIACRTTDAKRQLQRIVRTPEGGVEIDDTGKKNGRGAYLCRIRECWETALTRKAIDNALKITLDPDTKARLREYANTNLPTRAEVEAAEAAQGDTTA